MPTSTHGLYPLFFLVVGLMVSLSLAAVPRLLWGPQGHLQVPRMCVSSEAALFSQHRQEGPQQECVPLRFHPILQQESRGSPNIQEYTRDPAGWSCLWGVLLLSGSRASTGYPCVSLGWERLSSQGLRYHLPPSSTLPSRMAHMCICLAREQPCGLLHPVAHCIFLKLPGNIQ